MGLFLRCEDGIIRLYCKKDCSARAWHGSDGFPYELLTNGGDIMRTTLVLLYNLTWAAGLHPVEWDQALIRPLYKAKTKDPLVIEHYRAVTLVTPYLRLRWGNPSAAPTFASASDTDTLAHGSGQKRTPFASSTSSPTAAP